MRYPTAILFFFLVSCTPATVPELTPLEKDTICQSIQRDIDAGIEATRNKNIDEYMARIPDELLIHDDTSMVNGTTRIKPPTQTPSPPAEH